MINKSQIIDALRILQTNYPNFEIDQLKINLWLNSFGADDPTIFGLAVHTLLQSEKFAPTVAVMREYYNQSNPNKPIWTTYEERKWQDRNTNQPSN